MLSAPWVARLAAIAALCGPAGWLVSAAPAALAGAVGPGASPVGRAAAGAQSAPLVTDSGPARGSKWGLRAPAMSAAMRSANARKQQQVDRYLQVMTHTMSPDGKCTSLACRTGEPESRQLAATEQAQIRGYFCGPATISEMLAQLGRKVSQRKAARELGTTTAGTDWSDSAGYPMPNVLNSNQHINDYVAVALPWSPTRAQVKAYEADLVTDINHKSGAPLAGNAYEVPGGPHMAGHPTDQTIYHWFDIRGYQDSGKVTDYEDSVHGASSIGWSGAVPAYSSLQSSTIMEILGARGYDW